MRVVCRASAVNAAFGVSVDAPCPAPRLRVVERVDAIALAFPVDNSEEASLGLARRLLERREFTLAGPIGSAER